jgi:hypothetical protein
MPPPYGFRTWDEYFARTRGPDWDKNLPGYTDRGIDGSEEEEAETETQYFDPRTRTWKRAGKTKPRTDEKTVTLPEGMTGSLISPGECTHCGVPASTYNLVSGGPIVIHRGTACEAFKRQFGNPHGTLGADKNGWKTEGAKIAERLLDMDDAKRETTEEPDGNDPASIRGRLLEL